MMLYGNIINRIVAYTQVHIRIHLIQKKVSKSSKSTFAVKEI